ncbi:glycosyltransferase family 8 protein [Streptomyces paludis]|uniref:Glycosyltransferase family 8 protein n=1 Tax=Streptomyces paludis TaxID=2282738 RepID=A0A345HZ17_9ACTN|nr:glycosyltransferase family 8 protein [Streptomyces paludis]AXG81941.1 glycosyltransferase family 8 protein [Streptomyces paludis]
MTTAPRPLPALVCGVDDGYARPLRTLMRSIAAAHPGTLDELRLIVLDQRIGSANRQAILRDAEHLGLHTELRPVPLTDPRYPVSDWVSAAVYVRLAIPQVVPDERRVLYLDADTLVLGDLRPLLRQSLGGRPIGAVRDPQNPVIGRGIQLPGWEQLEVPYGRDYFNSGVMLIDLDRCRRLGVFDRSRTFLAEHPEKARFWDQDALNWAVDDNWQRLDRCWNTFAMSPQAAQPGFIHYAEADSPLDRLLDDEKTAALVHYAGPDKPWQETYPAGPLRDTYRLFHNEVTDEVTDDVTDDGPE